ncbi:MAG: response regulator [Verrucomicrobiae bacterium]|nr:response regulator [Verrucomicrobiae bacterium]
MAHKVLVIDDEAGFTKLLKMNLEKTGEFEVRIENNSMKALSAAREFRPDVILLDVVMPGLDGGDVAAQFQDDPMLRKVPVIMLTALVSPGETSQDAVAQSGSLTVLPKPVNLDKLTQCLLGAIETAA